MIHPLIIAMHLYVKTRAINFAPISLLLQILQIYLCPRTFSNIRFLLNKFQCQLLNICWKEPCYNQYFFSQQSIANLPTFEIFIREQNRKSIFIIEKSMLFFLIHYWVSCSVHTLVLLTKNLLRKLQHCRNKVIVSTPFDSNVTRLSWRRGPLSNRPPRHCITIPLPPVNDRSDSKVPSKPRSTISIISVIKVEVENSSKLTSFPVFTPPFIHRNGFPETRGSQTGEHVENQSGFEVERVFDVPFRSCIELVGHKFGVFRCAIEFHRIHASVVLSPRVHWNVDCSGEVQSHG